MRNIVLLIFLIFQTTLYAGHSHKSFNEQKVTSDDQFYYYHYLFKDHNEKYREWKWQYPKKEADEMAA